MLPKNHQEIPLWVNRMMGTVPDTCQQRIDLYSRVERLFLPGLSKYSHCSHLAILIDTKLMMTSVQLHGN